jgi:hypothetical protein
MFLNTSNSPNSAREARARRVRSPLRVDGSGRIRFTARPSMVRRFLSFTILDTPSIRNSEVETG